MKRKFESSTLTLPVNHPDFHQCPDHVDDHIQLQKYLHIFKEIRTVISIKNILKWNFLSCINNDESLYQYMDFIDNINNVLGFSDIQNFEKIRQWKCNKDRSE